MQLGHELDLLVVEIIRETSLFVVVPDHASIIKPPALNCYRKFPIFKSENTHFLVGKFLHRCWNPYC